MSEFIHLCLPEFFYFASGKGNQPNRFTPDPDKISATQIQCVEKKYYCKGGRLSC